jgi:hypothetical protein
MVNGKLCNLTLFATKYFRTWLFTAFLTANERKTGKPLNFKSRKTVILILPV